MIGFLRDATLGVLSLRGAQRRSNPPPDDLWVARKTGDCVHVRMCDPPRAECPALVAKSCIVLWDSCGGCCTRGGKARNLEPPMHADAHRCDSAHRIGTARRVWVGGF